MESKGLKERMSELKGALKSLCADKDNAVRIMNEMLDVQRQMDIEPTELHVPIKDVVATYNFGAFSLVKCRTCIIFKTTGYRLVAKPLYNQNEDGGVLYSQLSALCEMKERYDKVGKEEQDLWNLVFNMTVTILSLPIDAFANDKFLFDVATYIVKRKKELYDEILAKPLAEETAEDEIANDKFRQEVEAAQEMKKEAEDNA